MATCDNCGEKIGIFDSKYNYEDNKGKSLTYCGVCSSKFEKEGQEKKEKEVKILKDAELKKVFQKNNQWEYKIINLSSVGSKFNATGNKLNPDDEKKLNALGAEGWELVSASPIDSFAARLGGSSTATEWVSCIFKRKI